MDQLMDSISRIAIFLLPFILFCALGGIIGAFAFKYSRSRSHATEGRYPTGHWFWVALGLAFDVPGYLIYLIQGLRPHKCPWCGRQVPEEDILCGKCATDVARYTPWKAGEPDPLLGNLDALPEPDMTPDNKYAPWKEI